MSDRPIKDVEIRRATPEDIRAFYPNGSPRTCHAWCALYRGIPTCLAGLTVERGGCIAFSEVVPNDAPKITVYRTALKLMEHITLLGLPMLAACELCDKKAQAFVERLGFVRSRNYQGMELFQWQR